MTLDEYAKRKKRLKKPRTRVSVWFAHNQKYENWDENRLNTFHICIVTLFAIMYVCHVLSNPFLIIVQDKDAIIALTVIEATCLIIATGCLIKMLHVNGSPSAAKTMFGFQKNIRMCIYLFWIVRSLIVEIAKGQIMFAFLHVIHSITLYSTDCWYIINRKTLILNLLMFVSILIYEFLMSISPFAPKRPVWTFLNVHTSPNSLSRSNYFNLFYIFIDALIVLMMDETRSKYIFIVKKAKREKKILNQMQSKIVNRSLNIFTLLMSTCVVLYFCSRMPVMALPPAIHDTILTTVDIICVLIFFVVLKIVKSNQGIIYKLMRERRIIFILFLVSMLLYVDYGIAWKRADRAILPYPYFSNSYTFVIFALLFILQDVFAYGPWFPKLLFKMQILACFFVLIWHIYDNTFHDTNCNTVMPQVGLFGEHISICSIRRIIYQSFLSLMISPAFALYRGKVDRLYFVRANIFRSTGTTQRSAISGSYLRNILNEKHESSKWKLHAEKADEIIDEKKDIELSDI